MKEVSTVAAMNLGGNFNGSLFDMVVHAGFVVQLVLLLLLIFSVVSWAIILMKYFNIRKIKKENEFFLNSYMKSSKLSEMFLEAKRYRNSTLAEVFRSGYTELVKITRAVRGTAADKDAAIALFGDLEIEFKREVAVTFFRPGIQVTTLNISCGRQDTICIKSPGAWLHHGIRKVFFENISFSFYVDEPKIFEKLIFL